ncbi:hypothetical protein QYZ87_10875 [Porphyromonadaceae bacterium W3.11]|nr:hypothetical protein [Porphyromonadaceae bacterium W3.11]MDN4753414.1 hypothetical protein [Porphyromonadaceae bacterium W3.11]MDN4753647.1 hypothetical protein [Porphyromonadaceae bacterium W3.11]MDN4753899.1 hypothetical protein [Porphyromonadaceae bacterium W3.11]MDN4755009.1 hypothetical protein [Porphyromonadaceae bacterium W3.11]
MELDWGLAKKEFNRCFPEIAHELGSINYIDIQLTKMHKRPVFDIVKVIERLEKVGALKEDESLADYANKRPNNEEKIKEILGL